MMDNESKIYELERKISNLEDENKKLRERIKSLEAEIDRTKPVNPKPGA